MPLIKDAITKKQHKTDSNDFYVQLSSILSLIYWFLLKKCFIHQMYEIMMNLLAVAIIWTLY